MALHPYVRDGAQADPDIVEMIMHNVVIAVLAATVCYLVYLTVAMHYVATHIGM